MTKEELKKEAEEKANKVIIGSGMDRASVIHLKHLLTTFYIQGYHTGAEPREKRIAELEADNDARKFAMAMSEKVEKQLRQENAELKAQLENDRDLPAIAYMQGVEKQKKKDEEELKKWKDEWQEQVQKATDEGYARTLQTIQLTKAKEIIKNLLSAYTTYADSFDDRDNEIVEEACQFISEVEK